LRIGVRVGGLICVDHVAPTTSLAGEPERLCDLQSQTQRETGKLSPEPGKSHGLTSPETLMKNGLGIPIVTIQSLKRLREKKGSNRLFNYSKFGSTPLTFATPHKKGRQASLAAPP